MAQARTARNEFCDAVRCIAIPAGAVAVEYMPATVIED
jgi:hypothetical protein